MTVIQKARLNRINALQRLDPGHRNIFAGDAVNRTQRPVLLDFCRA